MTSQSKIGSNGECVSCHNSVGNSYVVCFFCKERFHAVNCVTTICNQSFHQLFKPLAEKTGVKNASRPGNFLFACDDCMTAYEVNKVKTDNNKIELLQSQVNELTKGMGEIKSMLMNRSVGSEKITNTIPSIPVKYTDHVNGSPPWNLNQTTCNANMGSKIPVTNDDRILNSTDEETKKAKNTSVLVIEKFSSEIDEKDSMDAIEKVIVNQKIDIQNSYKNKLGKTVIVCKSDEQRESLKTQISTALPTLPLKAVDNLRSTIVVAGFNGNYSEDNIIGTLVEHNDFIHSYIDLKSNVAGKSPLDNHLTLVTVKPLKNNPELFQVILKVSSNLRKLILKNGDKLRVGMKRCPVYDRFFVKRCFGCQHYGHFHDQCPTKNIFCCGKCTGEHETQHCDAPIADHKCINCIRAGKSEGIYHPATSLNCPIYINELTKIKQSSKN